jgi:uncharacterized protein (DUF302 family)
MQAMHSIRYGYVRQVNVSFGDAVRKAEAALKSEGFGVLCQIDMQAKLKEKLGVNFPQYIILGACNPPLAHQTLQHEINLGLLLPCNVVVYEQGNEVRIGVVDAKKLLSVVGNPEMDDLARQVNEKLRRVVDAV